MERKQTQRRGVVKRAQTLETDRSRCTLAVVTLGKLLPSLGLGVLNEKMRRTMLSSKGYMTHRALRQCLMLGEHSTNAMIMRHGNDVKSSCHRV